MKAAFFLALLFLTPLIHPQSHGFDHFFNYTMLDSNNISGYLNNYGTLNPVAGIPGFHWNLLTGDNYIVFDQGVWIVGKISGDTVLAINEWLTVYSPGPIINGQPAMLIHPEDSLRYRIYKINKGDDNSNPDFAEWPVDFGAPANIDNSPKVYGDQTHWCVYNALDSTMSGRTRFQDTISAVPLEVQQLVYLKKGHSNDYENIFPNTIFIEYTIVNKGQNNIDSMFIGFWTDIDFSGAMDNLPAVDSAYQLGYCWNNKYYTNYTNPAAGYTLLYGPISASPGSLAVFKGREIADYRNLPLYSFHGIGDDSIVDSIMGLAITTRDAWNFARGLSTNGNPIINPFTGQPTRFPFCGDPVTNTGWLFPPNYVGGGAGFVYFAGPVTVAPNDTQWIMLALVAASGRDNLESVSLLRKKAQLLHSLPYDTLAFGSGAYFITDANDNRHHVPLQFSVSQNYPNPFNPSTKISYIISMKSNVSLKIFDLLGNEVSELVNGEKEAGEYEVSFNTANLPSGVYFYQLRAGNFIETKKMILMK